jgi:peptidyl-Lys metalloendopeptidase
MLLLVGFLLCALTTAQLRARLETNVFHLEAQSGTFPVSITLTNEFSRSATLLKWNTPLDDATDIFRANMFQIVHSSGAEAVYTGIVMKRAPTLSDFVTFNPGQSITVELDLLKGYYFPAEGTYKIQLRSASSMHVGPVQGDSILESYRTFGMEVLESNPVPVDVLSLRPAPVWPPALEGFGAPAPMANCNSSASNAIIAASNNGVSASNRGISYISSSCTGAVYVRWFGTCDTTRANKVRSSLQAVVSGMNARYPVDCAGARCTANTYAYVFPTDTSHTVYVCGMFWRVPTSCAGANVLDTQPCTLVHEMSHFNNVAGTQDYQYGITNCQNLARNNPAQAVANADNYCFYTDELC